MLRSVPIFMSVLSIAGCAALQVDQQDASADTPISLTPTMIETSTAPSLTPTPVPLWSACPVAAPQPSAGAIRVAYVDGEGNLYVQDDAGSPQQLSNSGDETEVQISTDGNLIAYERNPAGSPPELWVIGADGLNARLVLSKSSIASLNPEITQARLDYWLSFRWIPYHHELLVEARTVTTDQNSPQFFAVYRLDPERLSLDRFPGPWETPFSPDGNWFAMPEGNSLSLIRTDGTQAYHKILDGYRFIGISSFSVLPPLAWLPDGVHLIFPPQDYPDADPRVPPFEIWKVPFGGTPIQVGRIEGNQSSWVNLIFFAPNGQYFVFLDDNEDVVLSGVSDETHQLGKGPLGYEVWWNPSSTHFLHLSEGLRLDDICGNSTHTPIEGQWGESSPSLEVRWIDPARAVIMRHGLTDAEGVTPLGSVYLFSATNSSLNLIAEDVQDADAALIP